MANFLGNQTVSTGPRRIHFFHVQSAQHGTIIPPAFGRVRLPPCFIWAGDFIATHHDGPSKGGGSAGSFYTYSISLLMAVAAGNITGWGRSWHVGNGGLKRWGIPKTQAKYSFFSLGQYGQNPWSYLSTKHGGQDLGYTGIALVGGQNIQLGTSANPPQVTFEVFGILPYAGKKGNGTNPADLVNFMFTDTRIGLGLPTTILDPTALNNYSQYCQANNFFLSAAFDQQKKFGDWFKLILDCTNSEAVWSPTGLKIVPYGDQGATANGVAWNPNLAPIYQLTDDDFVQDGENDPVVVQFKSPADLPNEVIVEYTNAGNDYNLEPVRRTDEDDILRNGKRQAENLQYHFIDSPLMASQIAQIKLNRGLYLYSNYVYRLPQRYILAEPMDVLGITDSHLGLVQEPVRVTEMQEEGDEDNNLIGDSLLVTVEEIGTNSTPGYSVAPVGPYSHANPGSFVNSINTPIIFEPYPQALANGNAGKQLEGNLEVWMLVSPQNGDVDYGGVNIYMSRDGNSYDLEARCRNAAQMGVLNTALPNVADPDNTSTLDVDLSESQGVVSALSSQQLADAGKNLAWVDGELINFKSVTPGTNPFEYLLNNLRRGRLGTTTKKHNAGTLFGYLGQLHKLDPALIRIPFPAADVGATLYFKFCAVNFSTDEEQDISTVQPYAFKLRGTGTGGPAAGKTSFLFNGASNADVLLPLVTNAITNVTLECWMSIPNPTNYNGPLIAIGNPAGGDGFAIGVGATVAGGSMENPGAQITGVIGTATYIEPSIPITTGTGTWHHVALVVDATGKWYFYLDGTASLSSPLTPGAITAPTVEAALGFRQTAKAHYNGFLARCAIYNTALTAARIAAHAACTTDATYDAAVLADNPLSYNNLDEVTGTTAADDSTGGTNAGTIDTGVTLGEPGPLNA